MVVHFQNSCEIKKSIPNKKDGSPSEESMKRKEKKGIESLKLTPQKGCLKKTSPRNETLKNVYPQNIPPKNISPRNKTHKNTSPINISPGNISHRDISPRNISHRDISPRNISPRNISPRNISPRNISPRNISPRNITLKNASPINISPRNKTLKNTSPINISQKNTSPKNISPRNKVLEDNDIKKSQRNENIIIGHSSPRKFNKSQLYINQISNDFDKPAKGSVSPMYISRGEKRLIYHSSPNTRIDDTVDNKKIFIGEGFKKGFKI
jgi:hypothetical protein